MKFSRREFAALTTSALAAMTAPRAFGGPLRVRRNVNTLSSTELDVMRAGITAMSALPVDNFRSRIYQSCVHGTPWGWEDVWGWVPDTATYWNQCHHGTFHFFTWHRWYLLYWEQIMRELSGTPAFDVPYWDSVSSGFLPAAVRVPADATNSLYNGTRLTSLNDGTAQVTGLGLNAMNYTDFADFSLAADGIEQNPHNPVHNQVGGNMGDVGWAGFDPLFFMHHANIDRYWECWLKRGGGRANPADAGWLGETFDFQTLAGPQVASASNCLSTEDLGYTYDACPYSIRDLLPKFRYLYWLHWRFLLPPFPDPPPPWEHVWLMSEPFVIDGRDMAFVLPRTELERAKIGREAVNVLLQDVVGSKLAMQGGFFTEAWLAPDAAKLKEIGLEGAVRIGNFGGFELSGHKMHAKGEHQHLPSVTLKLSPSALKLLGGSADPAVVFVRRGVVDREGEPIAHDPKAELFKVGALALVSGQQK